MGQILKALKALTVGLGSGFLLIAWRFEEQTYGVVGIGVVLLARYFQEEQFDAEYEESLRTPSVEEINKAFGVIEADRQDP